MKSLKKPSPAEAGFLFKVGKQIWKAVFLSKMEAVVQWPRPETLTEPFVPKEGYGRPPMPLATMLRTHFMQQWLGYFDRAMHGADQETQGRRTHWWNRSNPTGFFLPSVLSLSARSEGSNNSLVSPMARHRLMSTIGEVRP